MHSRLRMLFLSPACHRHACLHRLACCAPPHSRALRCTSSRAHATSLPRHCALCAPRAARTRSAPHSFMRAARHLRSLRARQPARIQHAPRRCCLPAPRCAAPLRINQGRGRQPHLRYSTCLHYPSAAAPPARCAHSGGGRALIRALPAPRRTYRRAAHCTHCRSVPPRIITPRAPLPLHAHAPRHLAASYSRREEE